MNKKIKTILAVAGVTMSLSLSSTTATAYYENDRFVAPVAVGAYSQNIAAIQTTLSNVGYFIGSNGITGSMNSTTRNAVKQFQADNGLKVDGVVGVRTAQLLNSVAINDNWRYNVQYRAPVSYQPVSQPAYYYNNNGFTNAPTQVQYRVAKPTRDGIYW